MAKTTNYNLEKPDENRNISDEFLTLRITLDQLDGILWAIATAVAAKAPETHGHSIAQINGLADALASKMASNKTFKFDDLTDVDGATAAATGHVLVKRADGNWTPSSAAAAIGAHGHAVTDIAGLTDAFNTKANLTGATFSGGITASGLTSSNANAIIQGPINGNMHLWFKEGSVDRGLFYYSGAADALVGNVYGASGNFTHSWDIREDGIQTWSGYRTILGNMTGDVWSEYRTGGTYFYRWYYASDGTVWLQRATNAAFTNATTVFRFAANGATVFSPTVYAIQYLIDGGIGGQAGMLRGAADGAAFNSNNNLLIDSWWGIGFRCSLDWTVRAFLNTRTGDFFTQGTFYAGSARYQSDGNVYMPWAGKYLSQALAEKPSIYTGTAREEVNFPVFHELVAYSNVAPHRNQPCAVFLSTSPELYTLNLTQTTPLSGNWIANGFVAVSGGNYVGKVTRVS